MLVRCRGFEGTLSTAIPIGAPFEANEFSSLRLTRARLLDLSFQDQMHKCTIKKFKGSGMDVYLADVKVSEIEIVEE